MEQDNATAGTPTFVDTGLENEVGESQGDVEIGADGDEIQNAVEKAMANPVILSKVFSHLEFPVLVNLRIVCKAWDEVIKMSPEFRYMFWTHVQRLFPCCTIAPVPKINPNLVKNVYITDRCQNEDEFGEEEGQDEKRRKKAAKYNLTTFFNQYHHYIENIKFDRQFCYTFYTSLVNALYVLDFPELQGIVIKDGYSTGSSGYCWNWGEYKGDLNSTFASFSTRPNLTSLQLDDTIGSSPFHDILQKLINCAPNLEKITINGNFYPDLSTCKNLKILNYSGIPYYYNENYLLYDASFNLESLSRMLDQAKHSLIKLSLKDSYLDCTPSTGYTQFGQFKFPDIAKELKVLSIQEHLEMPFFHPFQPDLKQLNPLQFPKLKNLSIMMINLGTVLGEMSHSFGTISHLSLSGIINPDIMHHIPILFPNLTNLTMPWCVGVEVEKPSFEEVIDFCSGWKLRKLDISTALQFDWSAFMAGLGRLKQTQNDLRMLVLRSRNDGSKKESESMFEVWYDSKKQQQPVTVNVDKENLIFTPQSIKKGMEGAVLEFILKHPVKVHFI